MDHYEPPSRQSRYPQRDRPPPPSYHDAPPPPPSGPRGDMFQFRGAASRTAGDSYRPGARNNDFNFSAGNAPSFAPSDNYPRARRNNRPRDGRGRGPPRGPARGGPRRFGPKPAHERDLMRREREPTPEQLEGMNEGQSSRFKVLDDLSDSDMDSDEESDHMDLESQSDDAAAAHASAQPIVDDSDDSEDEHPRAKRARVKSKSPEPPAKPKWSNPDPYTVLPPPDESQTKKKDVVKLIRKAKVEATKPAATASEGADFISLNFDDDFAQDNSDNDEGDVSFSGSTTDVPSLSHKPSFSHLDNLHPDRNLAPPPAEENKGGNTSLPLGRLDVWPPPADVHGSDPLGRSQFTTGMQKQDAKDAAAPVRQDNKKRKRRDDNNGGIVDEWLTPDGVDPAPWLAARPQGSRAEDWLHNEILDFHDFVKPRDFEKQVRDDLVRRMDQALRIEFPNLHMRAFGSFASGLYLPTADMDLVACSTQFLNRRISTIHPAKNWLYKFANRLKKADIAIETSVTVIWAARVPLVKFVEKLTGLRVDVSFENDSGLVANDTFQVWKADYPAMPIIVSLIKQFLVMRGHSEVFTGGLGGYSVICLTITVLRILEERNGRDWDPMTKLDSVLMMFLVYFGRDFDVGRDGIQMDPWQIVGKMYWHNSSGKGSKADRLLIIDPNNYDNDISGGSANVTKIFSKFSDAFSALNTRMTHAEDTYKQDGQVISILEAVWGGNYALFEAQRARLRDVWQRNIASGNSGAPRGNDGYSNNYPSGNGYGGSQGQGKPGNQDLGNSEKQGNQPKQGKRPAAGGDPKPNKKQKTGNAEQKRAPYHQEMTADVSGPARGLRSADAKPGAPVQGNTTNPAAPIPQPVQPKPASKKEQKKKKKESKGDQDRAASFKKSHPNINVPDSLSKKEYKKLAQKHGRNKQQ